MKKKYFGRERVCSSFIEPEIRGKTLNIGAGEVGWIEGDLFLGNKNFVSSDIDKNNLGERNPSINKVVADATNLPFEDKEFNQVIMLDVLEHIEDHEKALSEINRVLTKNGRFVICVPNDTWLSYLNPVRYVQHERHYKISQLKNLLKEHGFEVREVFAGGRIFELMNLYTHFLIKYTTGKIINPKFFDKLRDLEYKKHLKNGNEIAAIAIKR